MVLSRRCGVLLPLLTRVVVDAIDEDMAEINRLTRFCRRLSRTTVLVQFQRWTSLARRAASFCATFCRTTTALTPHYKRNYRRKGKQTYKYSQEASLFSPLRRLELERGTRLPVLVQPSEGCSRTVGDGSVESGTIRMGYGHSTPQRQLEWQPSTPPFLALALKPKHGHTLSRLASSAM